MTLNAAIRVAVAMFTGATLTLTAQGPPAAPPPSTSVAAPAFAEAISKSRGQVEALARRYPAIAVAVAVNDAIVWSEAMGWADVEKRVAATSATRFRIYSVFKPMTSALAQRLGESGRVQLDTPISTYLADLPPDLGRVTLLQLLSHTGGVRHYRSGEWMNVSRAGCARAADALKPFVRDRLLFAPGARTEYSSFGYVLASAVLESVTKRSFSDLITEEVLRPLNMTNTVPDDPSRPDAMAATPYESEGRLRPSTGIDNTCKAGAGGFRSTAEDVARFGMALLNDTSLPQGDAGIGVTKSDGLGRVLVQSGGAIGGRALLLVVPDRRIVVALAASLEGENLGAQAATIARAFGGLSR